MSSEENKAVVRRFITQVFENGQVEAVDELVSPDFMMHSVPDAKPGSQPLKDAMARVKQGLSQVSMRIEDLVVEGDKVAVRLTAHACQSGEFMGMPPSNREYTVAEMHLFTVRDGRIQEHWAVVDFLSIMKQLGALPEGPQAKPGAASRPARPTASRGRKEKAAR